MTLFDLYFDIKYIINLVNRKFLYENLPNAKIKKISILITIRDIDSKRYKASKYVRIKLYLLNRNRSIALIERELYIINNLIVKALIGIDIIKSKDIIIDL